MARFALGSDANDFPRVDGAGQKQVAESFRRTVWNVGWFRLRMMYFPFAG